MPRTIMPQTDSDKRFIFFIPEGVDIKDQHGNSNDAYELKGQKQAGKQVGKQKMSVYPTVPIATIAASLGNHPNGKYFLELWESQTGTTVDDALDSSYVRNPAVAAVGSSFQSNISQAGPLTLCQSVSSTMRMPRRLFVTSFWFIQAMHSGSCTSFGQSATLMAVRSSWPTPPKTPVEIQHTASSSSSSKDLSTSNIRSPATCVPWSASHTTAEMIRRGLLRL